MYRAKGSRGLTSFWSNSCLVSNEFWANRLPGKGRGAAVNAMNVTSSVVTLRAKVANPWRAGCAERCTSGSERGVGKHRLRCAPCSYSTGVQPTGKPAPVSRPCLMGLQVWGAIMTPPTWSTRAWPWKEDTEEPGLPCVHLGAANWQYRLLRKPPPT